MPKQLTRKIAVFSMSILCLFAPIPKIDATELLNSKPSTQSTIKLDEQMDYMAYLQQHQDQIETSYSNQGVDESLIEVNKKVGVGDEGVSYEIGVPQTGMYNIEVKYYPLEGKGAPVVRSLEINGQVPFAEAESITFERAWMDENKDYLMKSEGNQSFPKQIESPKWQTKKITASNGYYKEPFMFYLEKGENTLTFSYKQEPMEIEYIKLIPAKEVLNYQEYKQGLVDNNINIITNEQLGEQPIMVQAEDAHYKTTASLIPVNDRTSVKNIPYHPSNIVMNTMGGDSWSTPGEKINWQVEVPEAGFYKIATRFKQISNRDFYSIRKLEINGEIPFMEASELKFNYKSKFQLNYLGDEEEDYYFYLDKGMNEVSMSVSLGELGKSISEVEKSVKVFNKLYLAITNITGVNPDIYRDYKLTELIPHLVTVLEEEYDRLVNVVEDFGELSGQKTMEIEKMIYQLEKLIKKPNEIPKELTAFNDNISALSQWTMTLQKQPLLLDYILVCGEGYKLGNPEGNFYEKLTHNILAFIGSFTNDYKVTLEKADEKAKKSIEVWIGTPRDQYEIVQRLVNEAYGNKDVEVILKMVSPGAIMPATVTGSGPDVGIQLDSRMPTDFAFRGAAYDMSQFDDFSEVSQMFSPAAMEYFEYQGGYYALPDQMSFPVMFYREDILSNLGLDVPNTWDGFLEIIPYLQSNNMDIYMETPKGAALNSVFVSMLYQNNEPLYIEKGEASNLGSDGAMQVFKEWTEYYTRHNFSVTVDFLTRFRTGSVPLAIVDFTNYNTLKASAPEIEGNWSIAPIPGTVKADGSIESSVANTMVGSSMLIKNTVEKKGTEQEAWEFLKWWTSAETQVNYAQELEAILGTAARYPVANLEAVSQIPWDKKELDTIQYTIANLKGIPQVPGGYITGRYVENAFLKVVNDNFNPVDTLYPLVELIDQELENKRIEFNVMTK